MRRSTSKKVKISVLSSSGQVNSKKPSLSQIRLARIAHEKEKAQERSQEGIATLIFIPFQLVFENESADLTRYSRQLLADAYLETGAGDTRDFNSELDFLSQSDPGPNFQHTLDEDIDPDEDDPDSIAEDLLNGFV